ncbi:hypothetical protein V8C86DRAFT_2793340 [Haematococcus lacustris]
MLGFTRSLPLSDCPLLLLCADNLAVYLPCPLPSCPLPLAAAACFIHPLAAAHAACFTLHSPLADPATHAYCLTLQPTAPRCLGIIARGCCQTRHVAIAAAHAACFTQWCCLPSTAPCCCLLLTLSPLPVAFPCNLPHLVAWELLHVAAARRVMSP